MSAWVIDSSVLSPFARARRLGTLEQLTRGAQRLVTRSVRDELERGVDRFPDLATVLTCAWIETVRIGGSDPVT